VRLPSDAEHGSVSRLHCRLDIDPPLVWLRDLGSRNGTYLNGERLGQRDEGRSPDEAAAAPSSEDFVIGGDEIRVGNTVFSVEINWPEEAVPAGAPGDELLSVG
jgi:pSer/pThr/pTyr-binding forkhead associated (FHA) protein